MTKNKVIFHDYNTKRSVLADIAEWLRGGDHFNFIKCAEAEMKEYFSKVDMIDTGESAPGIFAHLSIAAPKYISLVITIVLIYN